MPSHIFIIGTGLQQLPSHSPDITLYLPSVSWVYLVSVVDQATPSDNGDDSNSVAITNASALRFLHLQ